MITKINTDATTYLLYLEPFQIEPLKVMLAKIRLGCMCLAITKGPAYFNGRALCAWFYKKRTEGSSEKVN
jgi:hypothetical protein